jgi:cytochrome P450
MVVMEFLTPFKLLTELNDEDIAAQVLAFLVTGLDTTSTLLSFASHQLAVHPEVQSRLQDEIDETLQEHGGKFTYEALNSMKYLGMVIAGEKGCLVC